MIIRECADELWSIVNVQPEQLWLKLDILMQMSSINAQLFWLHIHY